jgi:hypothetical protein
MSKGSLENNDENLLEIQGSPTLAGIYLAEFMRLYEHYRARALWDLTHPRKKANGSKTAKSTDGFTLKTRRDDWVRGAYKHSTPEFLARTTLAKS